MKKKTKKTIKKIAKKTPKIFIILGVVILLMVLGIGAFFGYESYQRSEAYKKELEDIMEEINKLPISTETDLIFIDNNNAFYDIKYTINSKYLSEDGKVSRPTYLEGDAIVTIEITIIVKNLIKLDPLFFSFFNVEDQIIIKNVKIVSLEMTALDKILAVKESLKLPSFIYASIGLQKETNLYEDIEISYTTSDENILTSDGVLKGTGEVKLTALIKHGDTQEIKEFTINCLNNPLIKEVDTDFYNFEKSSYAKSINYQNLVLNNVVSETESLKFRLEEEKAYIETLKIDNLRKLLFTFEFYSSIKGQSYTKNTFVKLLFSTDNKNYQEIKVMTLNNSDKNVFEHIFNNETGYLKILLTTEYASEKYVIIDDFLIERGLSNEDIKKDLLNNIPNKVSQNIDLPQTTKYGGIISYSSNDSNFNNGSVIKTNFQQTITLTVTIKGFGEDIVFEKELKIASILEVVNVEIFFIDVGKYGSSDCGESIYIKYGDIDILIDAGDDYKSTVMAVEEIINANSNDQVLDYLIATHPDSDHIGGMNEILEDYVVLNVIRFANEASSKKNYPEFNQAVLNEECNVCTSVESINNLNDCTKVIQLGDEVFIEFIDTSYLGSDDNNSRSIVCVLDAYGVRTLFTGDGDNNKYEIEKSYKDLVGNIDILKVVHHGTKNGTTPEFLNAIDPEVAIICNGNYFGNRHGHPTYQAIQNLYNYDTDMLVYAIVGGDSEECSFGSSIECEVTDRFVDRNGTIKVTIDNNGYSLTSEYNQERLIEIINTSFWDKVLELIN